MNWSFWGVLIPTVCYLVTAIAEFRAGSTPLALTFAGYALANVGFLWIFLARQ